MKRRIPNNDSKVYHNEDFTFEYNGDNYICGVDAEAEYYYTPGSNYNRYGDPGDPPDEDVKVISCDSRGFTNEDTGEEITDPKMIEILQDVVEEEMENPIFWRD